MKPKKLILCLIPNNICNLKCDYCYISQMPKWLKQNFEFKYSIEIIARSLSKERLGGECLINLTGEGETMLQKDIVELCELLLKDGHYIEFVTNLTITKVVDQFMNLSKKLLEHLEFKVSFHYYELKKKKLIDIFFANLEKIQKSGCSFTLELMPHDDIIDEIDDIINLCYDKVGAKCQLTIGRADYLSSRGILSKHSEQEYKSIWSKFESPMFELKWKLLNVKRKEFCYAGAWTLYVNLYTGEASACYGQPYKQNIFDDPSMPISFCPVGKHCTQPYCINGHAHISLGVIPEIDAPSFAVIRNRVRVDGTEWFSADAKKFFSSKLYETNEKYSNLQKTLNFFDWYRKLFIVSICHPSKVVKKIRYSFHKKMRQLKNEYEKIK